MPKYLSGSLDRIFTPPASNLNTYKNSGRVIRTTGVEGFESDVPEKRLMMAVLIDAYRTISAGERGGSNSGGQTFKSKRRALAARFWLFNDENWGPFSFVNICETLGIDKNEARDKRVIKAYTQAVEDGRAGRPMMTGYTRAAGDRRITARANRPKKYKKLRRSTVKGGNGRRALK